MHEPRLAHDKKDREPLSPDAFERFLKWLDGDVDSKGAAYLEMHRRLAAYFDRKNCISPDDLADETLNRVARRLDEEGHIATEAPAKYCYTVARYVFLEDLRRKDARNVPLDDELQGKKASLLAAPDRSDEKEIKEMMLNCLEKCTGQLEPQNRDMIVRYYFGTERVKIENRRGIAARLGISMNALSIRACRIRDKLEACVKECACQ